MLIRWLGVLFGLWQIEDARAPEFFDDDLDTLASRRR
jgi:hypothetical protein